MAVVVPHQWGCEGGLGPEGFDIVVAARGGQAKRPLPRALCAETVHRLTSSLFLAAEAFDRADDIREVLNAIAREIGRLAAERREIVPRHEFRSTLDDADREELVRIPDHCGRVGGSESAVGAKQRPIHRVHCDGEPVVVVAIDAVR